MTTLRNDLRDSATMLRRDVRHSLRYPMMTLSVMGVPIIFLLLFVGVFGNALRAGLGSAVIGGHYVDYLAPGIILMTASGIAETTAVGVCTDMKEGIIARFRTMAISRASVLTGRVLGSLIQALVSVVLVVAVAFALGFRPSASAADWVAAAGVFALFTLALTWLGVAFGLFAKTPEGANSLSLILLVLPFVSGAFVPTGSIPGGARWFATNQPFTPVIATLRGLLTGTPIGHSAVIAVAWSAVIAGLAYAWARRSYDRNVIR